MSAAFFSWLHLTDFHYGLKGLECRWPTLRGPFRESLKSLHERCGPWNVVFFTGDFVQAGKPDEFVKMQAEVLDPLWETLADLGSGDAKLLAVPGNHDLSRPDPHADEPAVDVLLDKDGFGRIQDKFWAKSTGTYRKVIQDAFANYENWRAKAPHQPANIQSGELPGDFSTTLACGSRQVGVIGLNTTFLQLAGGDYREKLVWDVRQLHPLCQGGVDTWQKTHDVCILMTHQGPSWLTPEARKHGESEIAPAGLFAVHLFGHQHETKLEYIRRGGSRHALRHCQGCSVFGMEKFGDPPVTLRSHGYAAGRIEFGGDEACLRLWPRIATSKTGAWRFVPDHENAELESDEGTPAEPVACQRRPTSGMAGGKAVAPPPDPSLKTDAEFVLDAAEGRGVYGRTAEIRDLSALIEETPVVVVFGLTGIGKSVLVNEVRRTGPVASRRAVAFRATTHMTLAQFYQHVAVVLGNDNEDPQPPSSGQFGEALFASQLAKIPPAFIHVEQAQHLFNNSGWSDPAIGAFLKLVAERSARVRVVLECREEPPARLLPSRHAKNWELRGLGKEATGRFFRRPFSDRPDVGWELGGADLDFVHRRLSHHRGQSGQAHPLAMYLLAMVAEGQRSPVAVLHQQPDLLVDQLEEKLFHDLYDSVLNAEERRVLRMCALYRDQIPDGHADRLNAAVSSPDPFGHLVRRRLLTPDEQHEWYSLHALIAELTAARTSPQDPDHQTNHLAIAEAWMATAGTGTRLSPPRIRATAEAVHHLIAGECYEKLAAIQLPLVKELLREQLSDHSNMLKKAGRSRENRYVLELLVGSNPDDHKHRRFLGETLEALGRRGDSQSLALYLEAHRLAPRFSPYLANLGRCWLARNEPQKFIEHVRQLSEDVRIALVSDGYCSAILSECLQRTGDLDGASQLRRSMIDAGSRNPAFYCDEAKHLIDAGNARQAIELLDKAAKLGIANNYTQSIRATALAAAGDREGASQLRRSMIDAGSQDAAFYCDEAKHLIDAGNARQAIELLDKAARLGIADGYTQSIRATALAAAGDREGASQLRRSMIDAGAQDAAFYCDEAKQLIDAGNARQAIELLDKAARLGIADGYTQSIRATVLATAGDRDGASQLRRSMIDAGSRNPAFYCDEAKHLIDTGHAREAIELLDKAAKLGIADDYTESIRATALVAASKPRSTGSPGSPKPAAPSGNEPALQQVKQQIRGLLELGKRAEAIQAIDEAGARGLIDREILDLRRQAATGR